MTLDLTECKDTRSQRANRYWFGVIVKMFREYNADQGIMLSADDSHTALKLILLPTREVPNHRTGEIMHVPAHSHNRTIAEFGDLIEAGVAFLSELGLIVPDPYTYGGVERRQEAA